jgi:hypothetical protein
MLNNLKNMTTKHRPSPARKILLAGLLRAAEANLGQLQTCRLTNNLKVDVTVSDDKDSGAARVHLAISRSSTYPTDADWRSILRHWPYPIQASPTPMLRYGRRYLTASWPTKTRMSTSG